MLKEPNQTDINNKDSNEDNNKNDEKTHNEFDEMFALRKNL
jgi:hypothetical protein